MPGTLEKLLNSFRLHLLLFAKSEYMDMKVYLILGFSNFVALPNCRPVLPLYEFRGHLLLLVYLNLFSVVLLSE